MSDELTTGQRILQDTLLGADLRDGEAKLLTNLIRAHDDLARAQRALEALPEDRREVLANVMSGISYAVDVMGGEATHDATSTSTR